MESDTQVYDYLGIKSDKSIISATNNEKILFTDKIIKINRFNMSQDRQIIVTDKALYNFKKKELKRRIGLQFISGISVSKITDEFVVHGSEDEYDYDYISSRKRNIIETLALAYEKVVGKKMMVCALDDKTLKDVVTSKAEKKKDKAFSKMKKNLAVEADEYLYGKSKDSGPSNQTNKRASISQENVVTDVFINTQAKGEDKKKVEVEDFSIISVIGRGTFGKVCLVEYRKNGELYAMKSIKKDILIETEQIENTMVEKQILETIDHPFICSLVFCFQTMERIYFIMNFLRGGELFQHLKKSKIFEEERVKFYAAIIGCALEHLHSKKIIYRDLKPENILMDDKGYLQLADFGMAKLIKPGEKAQSFCGTPEYIAPEILLEKGHDYMVDWWSYGILV